MGHRGDVDGFLGEDPGTVTVGRDMGGGAHAGEPGADLIFAEHLVPGADEPPVEIYVHRVRRKIEDSGCTIRTLRGFGYLLQADESV